MKRILIVLGVVLLLAAAGWGYTAYQAAQTAQKQAAADAEAANTTELDNVIWASGKLEPVVWAGLSPAASGIVSAILVQEGEWVEKGKLLLELDNGVLQSQVAVAEAAVVEAEVALTKLKAGATAAELAAAQAELAAAEANVALAAGQMMEVQAAIDAAKAQVTTAQRQYNELASHPTEAERTVAAADIAVAQAAVSQAQAAYNVVRGDPQIGSRPESMTLSQMTASLEAAKARAAATAGGPTAQQLAVAAATIDAARAQVGMAESRAPGVEAGVKAALARKASAQAALDRLLAGATPEDIAIAEARVQSAQAALRSAQAQLQQSQIVASIEGQVGAINVRVGELTTAGQFLILFGDTRQMRVKTTDLRETDVVRLRLEMPVEVTFDALPDQIFQGKVTQIAPVSTAERGSTNYTIQVELLDLPEAVRWGMTAFVNIQAPRDSETVRQ